MPCAKITENGIYSIINDYIGRPIQAYDNNGNLVWSCDYDIYGNLKNLKGDRIFIPFRQLGQYEDVETGLYYNRFRYYDLESGTYISKDPIGLAGGFALYAYVKDTNKFVDVFGLSRKPIKSRLPEGSKTGVLGPKNGILVQRNLQTGDMIKVEVKTTQQDKLWNNGEPKEIPLKGDQKTMGGESYTNDRLNRAANAEDGYTDGKSNKQAEKALELQRETIDNGAKVKTEKLDICVDGEGHLRTNPIPRQW